MTFKRNKRIDNSEQTKVWFWFLVVVVFLSLFTYGCLIRGTIVNIVARQDMETKLSLLNSQVSNLETEYLKAKNNITTEKAASLGFVAVTNQKFIVKNADRPTLSLLTSDL